MPLGVLSACLTAAMPHYLHPRSRSTSTLFTGCLAVSFLVVGIPHLLPCPVDRRQFADSNEETPKNGRRRRRVLDTQKSEAESQNSIDKEAQPHRNQCPFPKPKGILGQLMGFKDESAEEKPVVVVKSISAMREERREKT